MLWHKVQGAGGFGGAANIEYVGSAVYEAYTNNVTFSSSAISGLEAGDMLVVFISNDVSTNYATPQPSGWTTIYDLQGFNGTSYMGAFYHTASSSTDTAVTFVNTGGTGGAPAAVMVALRNVSSVSGSGSANTNNPPSQSCGDGDASLAVLHYQDDNAQATIGVPSGYTEADHAFMYVSAALSSGTWVGYKLGLSSGTEDPAAITGATGVLGAGTIILSA